MRRCVSQPKGAQKAENAMNAKTLTLAGAVAAAIAAVPLSAEAAGSKESCYGIALKGQNDCAAGGHSCAGESSADYSGKDFKYVPAGSCATMNVNGHKGSLAPV
jgi:uncharacterized membrane protein